MDSEPKSRLFSLSFKNRQKSRLFDSRFIESTRHYLFRPGTDASATAAPAARRVDWRWTAHYRSHVANQIDPFKRTPFAHAQPIRDKKESALIIFPLE
jgi:hypothetical protein